MEIKLDESSKEFNNLSTALDIVNKKIAEINSRAIDALKADNSDDLTNELLFLLKQREEVCNNNKLTISKILSTEENKN